MTRDGAAEGWGFPMNSRKAHYFRAGRSLCGKWMYMGGRLTDDDGTEGPDDCKGCRRVLDREKAAV